MDFAYWWSCIGKGMCLQPAQQAFFYKWSIFRTKENSPQLSGDGYLLKFVCLVIYMFYFRIVPVVCVVSYMFGFGLGSGPLQWVFMGELLPPDYKVTDI